LLLLEGIGRPAMPVAPEGHIKPLMLQNWRAVFAPGASDHERAITGLTAAAVTSRPGSGDHTIEA